MRISEMVNHPNSTKAIIIVFTLISSIVAVKSDSNVDSSASSRVTDLYRSTFFVRTNSARAFYRSPTEKNVQTPCTLSR